VRFSDELNSLVKTVGTELTLQEHKLFRAHVEKSGKPASAVIRDMILQTIKSGGHRQKKSK